MRKLSLLAVLLVPFLIIGSVHAQQFDVAIGVGTLTAPSASSASGDHNPVSLTGGAYPVFSADLLLKGPLGVSGELAWRGSRNLYAGFQPYRPLFYDFNGIYAPKLGPHAAAEVMARRPGPEGKRPTWTRPDREGAGPTRRVACCPALCSGEGGL